MKKNIFFIVAVVMLYALSSCSATGSVAYTPERKYSPEQLKEDVQVMEETFKKNHPSLYWYSSKEEIESSFKLAYEQLNDSLNEIQFRNIVAETIFPIRCGHTSVRFSKKYNQFIAGKRLPTFPFVAKVVDDSTLVVTANLNRRDSLIRTGTTILSINGLTARQVIDSLLPLVSIDGNAKNFSYQNISNNFTTYYNIRFGLQKNYTINYVNTRGEVKRTVLPLFDPARDTTRRRPVSITPQTPPPSQPEISERQQRLQRTRSFSIDSSKKFATLRISSFGPSLHKHFLKKAFRQLEIKNIPHLVIDVRNNGGGLIKKSLYLTRFISKESFVFTDSIYSVRRKIHSDAKVSRRFVYNLGLFFLNKKEKDGMYRFRFFNDRIYEPLSRRYNGQVYLLTGGFSFSATTLFAAVVKGQENVTVVGEETGGGYYGNNGVFIPEMILPNSKLRVRLPLYRIVNNKNYPKDGHGVLPDVEAKASAESIRQNRDPKMEKAIQLIMQRKG
ncbi:S41 family peptidase [Lacibacter sp. H375]|uniref:S41 family peptidase n=1 Tax=Lacibacter sp. H375 TaxID=3133424 RepID=UPI0030BF6A57